MSKMLINILFLLVIIQMGIPANAAWFNWWHHKPTSNILVLYGNIDEREVNLAFQVSGQIMSMPVQSGETVKKGELLATLDNKREKYRLSSAKAQYKAAIARLSKLLAGTRPEKIDRLKAIVAADKAQVALAQVTYQRIKKLAKSHLDSQQHLDQVDTTLQAEREKLKADRASLALALAGPRIQDIQAARFQVKSDQAQVALAKINLTDTYLIAPSNGIVRNRILEPGDLAAPSSPVYSIALTQPLWVRTYIDEPDLGKIHLGSTGWVTSDAFAGHKFFGWVGYISPIAEFTPKQVQSPELRTQLVYEVRVYICNGHRKLHLGMPVTVHINIRSKANLLKTHSCS